MKKDDTYKDKGLRVAVQHKNDTAGKMTLSEDFTDRLMQRIEQQDEKPVQHRMKFWPWIAAACVAAFLVVLLAPPRKEAITEPQINFRIAGAKVLHFLELPKLLGRFFIKILKKSVFLGLNRRKSTIFASIFTKKWKN